MSADATPATPRLRALCTFAMLTYPFACMPFLWFYFRDHGIDIAAYAELIAVYYVVMVVAEVPTGLFADRCGRKVAMFSGPLVLAAGFTTLRLGRDWSAFAVGEALLGLGHALLSGPPSALLFDTLAHAGVGHRFLVSEAGVHAWRTLGTALAFLLGGVVAATFDHAATITCTAVLCAGTALVALALREPPRARARAPALLATAWRELQHREVRWIAIYYVLVFCLLRYCYHTYQPYLDDAGLEHPLALGALFCALSLSATPWSRAVPGLLSRYGERRVLWWLPLSLCASLAVMAGTVGAIGIALFFVHQAPFGAHWPAVQSYANHGLTETARATALSILSFAGRIVFAAVFPLLSYLHARVGIATTYAVASITGLLATCAVMTRQPRS